MEHHLHEMLITMVAAISAGVMLIALSRRMKTSAIVLLLIGGVLLGPEILGIVHPESLGDGLRVIVSLAVGLILFEGGLTLDIAGYRTASSVIRRLLSVGVLVTWFGTFAAIKLLFPDFGIGFSLLAASLVIVTGPTVIAPLLKRIKVNQNLHSILHWEGVLIDPLGVFIALLCYEWLVGRAGGAVGNFSVRVLGGLAIGAVGGHVIYFLIKRRFIPEDMMNVSALALAVMFFGIAEYFMAESGLLAVTVCGFVLGFKRPVELKQIRSFKAEITDLMIGMLFILLAARLEFSAFREFGLRGAMLVAIVMLVVRPLNILLSTAGLKMTWREKTFLSWVAPRGIVAASMASFIAISLSQLDGYEQAAFLEPFTYSVITATVLIQGFTAGPLASLLKLKRPAPTGWLIVGGHHLARRVARFIKEQGELPVLLVDTNAKTVRETKNEGLPTIMADARDVASLETRSEVQPMGNLLALTDNEDLNSLLCQRWMDLFGRNHVFRWHPHSGDSQQQKENPGLVVWPRLPKPSLLSAEIARGEAATVIAQGPIADPGNLTIPLVARVGKTVDFDPAPPEAERDERQTHTLYLRREADYLMRSTHGELVARIDVRNVEELFERLVDLVVQRFPKVHREETVQELLERERSFPTALGHGIAVPHAYSHALESRLCVVAQIPNGVDFHAPDEELVRLVFLLLSPTGDPEGHLATMAEIARLVSDADVRERLLNAADPVTLLPIVRTFNASPPSSSGSVPKATT